jgi:hypothetical protein
MKLFSNMMDIVQEAIDDKAILEEDTSGVIDDQDIQDETTKLDAAEDDIDQGIQDELQKDMDATQETLMALFLEGYSGVLTTEADGRVGVSDLKELVLSDDINVIVDHPITISNFRDIVTATMPGLDVNGINTLIYQIQTMFGDEVKQFDELSVLAKIAKDELKLSSLASYMKQQATIGKILIGKINNENATTSLAKEFATKLDEVMKTQIGIADKLGSDIARDGVVAAETLGLTGEIAFNYYETLETLGIIPDAVKAKHDAQAFINIAIQEAHVSDEDLADEDLDDEPESEVDTNAEAVNSDEETVSTEGYTLNRLNTLLNRSLNGDRNATESYLKALENLDLSKDIDEPVSKEELIATKRKLRQERYRRSFNLG